MEETPTSARRRTIMMHNRTDRNMQRLARLSLLILLAIVLAPFSSTGVAQDGDSDQDEQEMKRLARKMKGEVEDDTMSRVIELMGESEERLGDRFDSGDQTQAVQRRIIKELISAISQARQGLRRQKSRQSQKGDQRKEGQTPDSDAAQEGDGQSTKKNESDATGGGGDKVEAVKPGSLYGRKRQWGNLPPRDREEIMQSLNEDSHEKYEVQIKRYYEALAEPQGAE